MAQTLVEGVGSANYYNHISSEEPLLSTGFAEGLRFQITIETLAYSGTDQIGYDVYFRRPAPDGQNCFHWSGITPSGNPTQTLQLDFPPPPGSVEWSGTAGATGCLDFTRVLVSAFPYTYPGNADIQFRVTVTYTPAGTAPGPCIYGTRVQPGNPVVQIISDVFLATVLKAKNADWLRPYLANAVGSTLDSVSICGKLPPDIPPFTPDMLLNPGRWWVPALHAVMWDQLCECIPGVPPPTPPGPPDLTEPTGSPPPIIYVVNPDNPCFDFPAVLQKLDAILRIVSSDLQLDTFVQRQLVPGATARGAAYTGLTDGGSIAISAAIGVQIVITEGAPGRQLEGAPPYIWDLGWISVLDGNGFIQERRITRQSDVWMPRIMSDATTVGYFFKPGVTGDIHILHALP